MSVKREVAVAFFGSRIFTSARLGSKPKSRCASKTCGEVILTTPPEVVKFSRAATVMGLCPAPLSIMNHRLFLSLGATLLLAVPVSTLLPGCGGGNSGIAQGTYTSTVALSATKTGFLTLTNGWREFGGEGNASRYVFGRRRTIYGSVYVRHSRWHVSVVRQLFASELVQRDGEFSRRRAVLYQWSNSHERGQRELFHHHEWPDRERKFRDR